MIFLYITYLQNLHNLNMMFLFNFYAAQIWLLNYTSKVIWLNDSYEKVHIDRQIKQTECNHDP